MADYAETLFQAVDILLDKKIQQIKFDETIKANIVDDSKADIGEYLVSTGEAKFTAYSTETKYRNNETVMVTIPQGDYNNQKIIIGKYVDKSNTPKAVITPFDSIIDLTNNLIKNDQFSQGLTNEIELWANDRTQNVSESDEPAHKGYEWIPEHVFKNSTAYRQFQHWWSWDYNGITEKIQGYGVIGLRAQFSTWLAEYGTYQGNYGLALELIFDESETNFQVNEYRRKAVNASNYEANRYWKNKGTNDEPDMEKISNESFPNNIEAFYELVTNEETKPATSVILTFDSDEFFGNVYAFDTYYTQEAVFDISDYKDYPIIGLKLYPYQRQNFKGTDEILGFADSVGYGDFGTVNPNIFIKDPFICFGQYADTFKSDTAEIMSDNLTYDKTAEKNEYVISEDKQAQEGKTYYLKYTLVENPIKEDLDKYYEFDNYNFASTQDNDIIEGHNYYIEQFHLLTTTPNQNYFTNNLIYEKSIDKRNNNNLKTIKLRWVHKDDNTGQIAVVEDGAIPGDYEIRWYYHKVGASSPDNFAGAHWKPYYGKSDNVDEDTGDWLNDIINDNVTDHTIIQFQPNVNNQNEQLKVIIIKNENGIEKKVVESNILEFTNNIEIRNQATLIDLNALAIKYVNEDGSPAELIGTYFLYDESNHILNNADKEIRFLQAVFDPDENNIYQKSDLIKGNTSFIKWIFPSEIQNSMIQPLSKNDIENKYDDKKIENREDYVIIENVTKVPFRIKDTLNRQALNNTVFLEVVIDGQPYKAEVSMLFGTAGTSGSDYTVTILWDNNENVIDVSDSVLQAYATNNYNIGENDLGNRAIISGTPVLYDQFGHIVDVSDSDWSVDWFVSESSQEDIEYAPKKQQKYFYYPIFIDNTSTIYFNENVEIDDENFEYNYNYCYLLKELFKEPVLNEPIEQIEASNVIEILNNIYYFDVNIQKFQKINIDEMVLESCRINNSENYSSQKLYEIISSIMLSQQLFYRDKNNKYQLKFSPVTKIYNGQTDDELSYIAATQLTNENGFFSKNIEIIELQTFWNQICTLINKYLPNNNNDDYTINENLEISNNTDTIFNKTLVNQFILNNKQWNAFFVSKDEKAQEGKTYYLKYTLVENPIQEDLYKYYEFNNYNFFPTTDSSITNGHNYYIEQFHLLTTTPNQNYFTNNLIYETSTEKLKVSNQKSFRDYLLEETQENDEVTIWDIFLLFYQTELFYENEDNNIKDTNSAILNLQNVINKDEIWKELWYIFKMEYPTEEIVDINNLKTIILEQDDNEEEVIELDYNYLLLYKNKEDEETQEFIVLKSLSIKTLIQLIYLIENYQIVNFYKIIELEDKTELYDKILGIEENEELEEEFNSDNALLKYDSDDEEKYTLIGNKESFIKYLLYRNINYHISLLEKNNVDDDLFYILVENNTKSLINIDKNQPPDNRTKEDSIMDQLGDFFSQINNFNNFKVLKNSFDILYQQLNEVLSYSYSEIADNNNFNNARLVENEEQVENEIYKYFLLQNFSVERKNYNSADFIDQCFNKSIDYGLSLKEKAVLQDSSNLINNNILLIKNTSDTNVNFEYLDIIYALQNQIKKLNLIDRPSTYDILSLKRTEDSDIDDDKNYYTTQDLYDTYKELIGNDDIIESINNYIEINYSSNTINVSKFKPLDNFDLSDTDNNILKICYERSFETSNNENKYYEQLIKFYNLLRDFFINLENSVYLIDTSSTDEDKILDSLCDTLFRSQFIYSDKSFDNFFDEDNDNILYPVVYNKNLTVNNYFNRFFSYLFTSELINANYFGKNNNDIKFNNYINNNTKFNGINRNNFENSYTSIDNITIKKINDTYYVINDNNSDLEEITNYLNQSFENEKLIFKENKTYQDFIRAYYSIGTLTLTDFFVEYEKLEISEEPETLTINGEQKEGYEISFVSGTFQDITLDGRAYLPITIKQGNKDIRFYSSNRFPYNLSNYDNNYALARQLFKILIDEDYQTYFGRMFTKTMLLYCLNEGYIDTFLFNNTNALIEFNTSENLLFFINNLTSVGYNSLTQELLSKCLNSNNTINTVNLTSLLKSLVNFEQKNIILQKVTLSDRWLPSDIYYKLSTEATNIIENTTNIKMTKENNGYIFYDDNDNLINDVTYETVILDYNNFRNMVSNNYIFKQSSIEYDKTKMSWNVYLATLSEVGVYKTIAEFLFNSTTLNSLKTDDNGKKYNELKLKALNNSQEAFWNCYNIFLINDKDNSLHFTDLENQYYDKNLQSIDIKNDFLEDIKNKVKKVKKDNNLANINKIKDILKYDSNDSLYLVFQDYFQKKTYTIDDFTENNVENFLNFLILQAFEDNIDRKTLYYDSFINIHYYKDDEFNTVVYEQYESYKSKKYNNTLTDEWLNANIKDWLEVTTQEWLSTIISSYNEKFKGFNKNGKIDSFFEEFEYFDYKFNPLKDQENNQDFYDLLLNELVYIKDIDNNISKIEFYKKLLNEVNNGQNDDQILNNIKQELVKRRSLVLDFFDKNEAATEFTFSSLQIYKNFEVKWINIYSNFCEDNDIENENILYQYKKTNNKTLFNIYDIFQKENFKNMFTELTSLINDNIIFFKTDQTSDNNEIWFNYLNDNVKLFIFKNNEYILDPYSGYKSDEIYYMPENPILIQNNQYEINTEVIEFEILKNGLLICSYSKIDNKIKIKPKEFTLNDNVPSITTNNFLNSLSIIELVLSNFGDYNLVYREPIALKAGTEINENNRIIKQIRNIQGPTEIWYPTNGTPEYNQNPYKIFIQTLQNETNIEYEYEWKPFYVINNEETDNFLPLMDEKTHSILKPISVYVNEARPYGVQCIQSKYQIQTENEITTKTLIETKILWSQPIYVYQNKYPSKTLNQWNGRGLTLKQDEGIIIGQAFAAGKKNSNDNTFSGVMLGDWSADTTEPQLSKQTGIYGFSHGEMSYAFKEDGTAFIGKNSTGRIYFNGNKAEIFSTNWKGNQPNGIKLDLDDGYIEMAYNMEKHNTYIIIDENNINDYFNPTSKEYIDKNNYLYAKDKNNNNSEYIAVEKGTLYNKNKTYAIKDIVQKYITIGANENKNGLYALSIGRSSMLNSRPFRVDWDGNAFITNGQFTGSISGSIISGSEIYADRLEANNGQIGGWVLDSSSLSGGETILDSQLGITTNIISIGSLGKIGYIQGKAKYLNSSKTYDTDLMGIKTYSVSGLAFESSGNIRLSGHGSGVDCDSIFLQSNYLHVTAPANQQFGIYARFA